MKKFVLLFPLFCLLSNLLLAQKTEGVVLFDEKINLHKNLPPDAADARAMMPEWNVHKDELLFTASESLFRNLEADEEEDEDGGGRGGMVIKIQRPPALYYRNFDAGKQLDQRDFMGKVYLVEDSLVAEQWKMTGEAKQILGYNCLKATRLDSVRQRTVAVWFTEEIPVPAGPATFCNLPGMVLEADINDGDMVFVAMKVEFKKLGKKDIEAPTKGEKTSAEAFNKKVAEVMKNNGGRMIRINRN